MNDQDTEAYIDLAAAQAGLDIAPEWREAVISYYRLSARMAAILDEHPLPSTEEPAPVFSA